MTESKRDGTRQAEQFIKEHPEVWQQWVSPEAADRLQAWTGQTAAVSSIFPDWSIQDKLNSGLKSVVGTYGESFRQVSGFLTRYLLSPTVQALAAIPAWLMILLTAALAWHSTRSIILQWRALSGCM